MRSEHSFNVAVDDEELERELKIPWKYFVVFAHIDMDAIDGDRMSYPYLTSIIALRYCTGETMRILFHKSYIDLRPKLLDRVVVVLKRKVEVEELMSTALCCVNYSLQHSTPRVSCLTTAGFSFGAGEHRYVATSLHGKLNAHKQQISSLRRAVILADAFGMRDEKHSGAGEVGYVVCDWRTDYLDVGLIQLHDEHKSTGVWFTEEQVVEYMVELMKATYDIDWDAAPVHIHSASVFSSGAGVDRIPGKLIRVWDVGRGGSSRKWHFLVQMDVGHAVVPGQSGSAVTLVSDGRPIGMLVGRVKGDPTMAVVTPLHHIYASVNSVLDADQKVHLCTCHQCPVSVAESQRATKLITDRSLTVYCKRCNKPHTLQTAVDGEVGGCCGEQHKLANESVQQRIHHPLSSSMPTVLPYSCTYWNWWQTNNR